MKRDVRLHGLSSDHHRALVLVRRIREAVKHHHADAAFVTSLHDAYQAELRPHFAVEEELLIPALAKACQSDIVSRVLSEHGQLSQRLDEARAGQLDALEQFAALLEVHIRFEERELFPLCEAVLDASVLDAVAARAPKRRG
jgi:hemerythrin-like domain-containing protein